jgi:hypothetical protein
MGRNALLLAKMEGADGRAGVFIGAGPNPHVLFDEAQGYLLRQGVPGFIKPHFFPSTGRDQLEADERQAIGLFLRDAGEHLPNFLREELAKVARGEDSALIDKFMHEPAYRIHRYPAVEPSPSQDLFGDLERAAALWKETREAQDLEKALLQALPHMSIVYLSEDTLRATGSLPSPEGKRVAVAVYVSEEEALLVLGKTEFALPAPHGIKPALPSTLENPKAFSSPDLEVG